MDFILIIILEILIIHFFKFSKLLSRNKFLFDKYFSAIKNLKNIDFNIEKTDIIMKKIYIKGFILLGSTLIYIFPYFLTVALLKLLSHNAFFSISIALFPYLLTLRKN